MTRLAQGFQMKFDTFTNEFHDFATCRSDCDTAGQVGHIGAEVFLPFFYNDQIFHWEMLLLFKTGVFENIVQSANRHVISRLSCNRYNKWFYRMFELTVTAFGAEMAPSVVLQHSY